MQDLKVCTIIGARPQFIKSAPVSKALKLAGIKEVLIHTGQHYDPGMSDIFFSQMNIPRPDHFLNINQLSHAEMTGKMLIEIEKILMDEKPDWVLVYGDTNSTLAGALAAKKLLIPVAHVEAGLRSFNRNMPEEINRIVTDSISDIAYCPTATAVSNLKHEGFTGQIIPTGDVMLDAARYFEPFAEEVDVPCEHGDHFALVTFHRQENTDDPIRLGNIVDALNRLALKMNLVLPLHPRTRKKLEMSGSGLKFSTIDPVGYLQMISLLKRCELVVTDSGGLQKEAFFFKKPCITLRDETEWVELVDHGYNKLVSPDNSIDLIAMLQSFENLSFSDGFYGDGNAATLIANELSSKS